MKHIKICIAGFGCGVAATISCDFLTTANASIGIWCESSTPLSSWGKAGRAFSVLALVFGGLFLLMDMGMIAMSPNRNKIFRSGGMSYLICCTFSGLSFLAFDGHACGENGCSISKGATLMISSIVLWLASAVSIMILYPPCVKRQLTADEEHTVGPSLRDPLMKGDSIAQIKQDRHGTSMKNNHVI